MRVGALLRFALLLATSLTVLSFGTARPALADCVLTGTTVVCSGNSPGGFEAGVGINGLTVTVQTDAAVGTGITLNDNSSVSNFGTVSVGDGTAAITANDFNTIVNSGGIAAGISGSGVEVNTGGSVANSGMITVGDSGFGILANGDNVNIGNSGTIRFGDCGSGISAFGSGISVTNTGSLIGIGCGNTGIQVGDTSSVNNSGLIQIGDTGIGIDGGNGTTIVNSGTIVAGANGIGIFTGGNIVNSGTVIVGDTVGFGGGLIGQGDNLSIINTGTIIGGDATPGIAIIGDAGILNNSGTIIVGNAGGGLAGLASGDGNTYLNSGVITVGADGIGISAPGNNSIVNNSGTINVGSCGFGIDSSQGSGASITNSGRVIASGCSATGVFLGDNDTLTNSGLIQGPATGFSVLASGANNTVFNSGTLDGPVNVVGGGNNLVTNAGLITVSAPLTPGAGVAHAVDGVFTQNASGTLALRVGTDPAAANFDSLGVTGVANLGGTLRAVVQPGLYGSSTTYAGALTFASSTGGFASVESGLLFLNASAIYNSTSIDLVLTRLPFNQFPGGGSNGRAVGNALEAQYSTSLTGTAATFYSQLLQSTAPNTLAQLSGEIASAGQNASFGAFSQLFGTVFGQINTSRTAGTGQAQAANGQRLSAELAEACIGDACQEAPSGRRVNYWAQGFGAAGSYDANASVGSTAVSVTSGGGATGIDIYVSPGFLLGGMLGTTSTGFTMADLASTGTSQAIVFGAYSSYTAGAAYLDAALAYGIGSFTTQRFVGTGSISEQVNGAFSGNQYGGRVEGGRRFEIERFAITPYANLTVQALQQNAYTEVSRNIATGAAGLTGLNVQAQTTTSVRSVLGAEFATTFAPTEDLVVRPRARLGWAHEFNTYRASTASFAALGPGVPLTVQGASPASDALVVQAAVEVEVGRMFRIYGQFDGDFASTARSYAGTGGIRLVW
ncbi:MAG: autotransporter domain-containing protein [Reyranella sp.]|nr:autotransporter domain-containing protein [Reyranella sp.]